jgi:hypothetical protein
VKHPVVILTIVSIGAAPPSPLLLLRRLAREAELTHLRDECRPLEPESGGGTVRATDNPVCLPEGLEDVRPIRIAIVRGASKSICVPTSSATGACTSAPFVRVTERSMKFSSSRMSPGQRDLCGRPVNPRLLQARARTTPRFASSGETRTKMHAGGREVRAFRSRSTWPGPCSVKSRREPAGRQSCMEQ